MGKNERFGNPILGHGEGTSMALMSPREIKVGAWEVLMPLCGEHPVSAIRHPKFKK